ncbi:MAG: NAD(P)H-dependent oxidoreductase [Desulfobacterales bacterium]|nr:NAD(P)H-dependent oxidoreductase [Desulfobacterales bacterium]
MKILVLYFSKGGNTRKLAQAVAEGVDGTEGAQAVLKTCEEVTKEDFLGAGGIVAGSPVYFGGMAAELKQIFDGFVSTRRKMEGKVGAAFTTSGDATGGKETTMMGILQSFLIYGMVITGDPMAATGHYGVACVGAPDEKAIENGKLLGRRVADLALKLGK